MPASGRSPFQYAIVRVVPRIERGECFNVGVVLLCRPRRFLGARVWLDRVRLAALAPDVAPETVEPHLLAITRIAAGAADGGPIARLTPAERFHWLVAPSSTMVQPSAVHTGLCTDPEPTLATLFSALVLSSPRAHPSRQHAPTDQA